MANILDEIVAYKRTEIAAAQERIALEEVRAACEFLGLDPLYAANEGKVVLAVAAKAAEAALAALHAHPFGREAVRIGQVTAEHAGRVVLHTPYGARRIVQMLTGAQLPRIC